MQGQVELPNMRSSEISEPEISETRNLAIQFQCATGSIIGRNHVLVSKNNQDAYRIMLREQFIVAIVCDGCSAGMHSEVGAKMGVRMISEEIGDLLDRGLTISEPEFWNRLKHNLLQKLQDFIAIANGHTDLSQSTTMEFVNDYLLFTSVVALITPSETVTFSIGDGAIAINGKFTEIPPYADNAPPYLAYGIYKPEAINFEIRDRIPTSELESLLIATDGISDLVQVEDINQFWQEERYFKNPDAIRRKLAMLNREETKPDWNKRELIKRSGVLSDDTSLVVIRRITNDELIIRNS